MKISELVAELESFRDWYGDADVHVVKGSSSASSPLPRIVSYNSPGFPAGLFL